VQREGVEKEIGEEIAERKRKGLLPFSKKVEGILTKSS